jgi:hypothetical protein
MRGQESYSLEPNAINNCDRVCENIAKCVSLYDCSRSNREERS